MNIFTIIISLFSVFLCGVCVGVELSLSPSYVNLTILGIGFIATTGFMIACFKDKKTK